MSTPDGWPDIVADPDPAEAQPARRSWPRRLLKIAVKATVAWLVLTVLMVLPWRWLSPPTTAFIVREQLRSDTPVSQRWAGIEQISPHLAISVVASEDQKFPTHHGFDLESIGQAFQERSQRTRGASTISQQVAKNLYLWPGPSLFRKGLEAYMTVFIELLWPKRRILEVYLNVAEFGPGVFGAGAASRHHFDKTPADLTPHEAALLAAVLPSPRRMSAGHPSTYVLQRADEILEAVRILGGRRYLRQL